MKPKNGESKLSLNKTTVAALNKLDLDEIFGGTHTQGGSYRTDCICATCPGLKKCYITNTTTQNPDTA